jgi:hypothetical protein
MMFVLTFSVGGSSGRLRAILLYSLTHCLEGFGRMNEGLLNMSMACLGGILLS